MSGRAEQRLDLLRERLAQVSELAPGLEPAHELGRRADADVAVDQRLLEAFPASSSAASNVAGHDLGRQRAATLRERVAEPAEEAGALGLVGRGRLVAEEL